MQTNHFKAILKNAARVLAILPFAAAVAFGQTPTINLAASPTTTTLPDGTVVPMWGYFCGAAVTGSTAACAALNPTSATTPTWSPVVITVPIASPGTATSLTINLTNNLSFPTTTAPNTIPTSIVILGQVGGGLGLSAQRTTTQSPDHTNAQGCATWFIADPSTPPGVPCAANVSGAFPPTQGQRVQSFSTEVAAAGATLVAPQVASGSALTWTNLRPGTYLLESGTHPSIQVPMGLIGMLVVTTAASSTTPGNAYPAVGSAPAVPYNAELPLEFSEIDPVQNKAVDQAVRTAGFSETTVWGKTTGDVVAVVTVTSGGTGYTSAPSVSITGGGGSGATASASLSFGVAAVAIASGGSGYLANQVLTFTDGDGTGATATVTSVGTGGVITGVTVSSPGSGYTVAPTTVTGGTGTGAVLTATLATTGSVGSVSVTNGGAGYTSTAAVSLTGGGGSGAIAVATVALPGCGIAHTCYPPAVNYTPFYYLINGVAFNKTNAPASVFAAYAGIPGAATAPVTTGITGAVLARLVNAGLRMHVPSIVGSLTNGFSGAGAAATVSGFTLIAEDGNPIPGVQVAGATTVPAAPRVQTHVFMAAGKTFDVMFNVPATATTPALPIYDRELSLSANSSTRDAGMLAYIGVNGSAPNGFNTTAGATQTGVFAPAMARPDTYNAVPVCVTGATSCTPLVVSDVSKGVIANDTNVYGVTLLTAPAGTLTCNAQTQNPVAGICENGTFTYTPNAGSTGDSFTYCANGTVTAGVCSSGITAMVNLGGSTLAGNPTAIAQTYTARTSTYIKIPSPGLLTGNSDPNNLTLTVVVPTTPPTGVVMDANGGFTASVSSGTSPLIFGYTVQNSQGRTATGTVTVNFPTPSNLQVTVVDAQAYSNCQGDSGCIGGLPPITDYRWIIEEDKTFWIDPNCTTNNSSTAPGCPAVVAAGGTVPTFGTNFHASHMGYVDQGCTGPLSCEGGQTMLDTRTASPTFGQHIPAVCDLGNGACRPDPNCTVLPCTASGGTTPVNPSYVHLDPTKRYYISVLPGDAANPFPGNTTNICAGGSSSTNWDPTQCGHGMSGAQVQPACNIFLTTSGCTPTSTAAFAPVTVKVLPTPVPTAKLSVFVFEDDFPLNGEQDGGGGSGVVAPLEPGLGGFEIILWDTYGGLGDFTGQDTHDAFNQPLSNSLAGTIDPATGLDACPISAGVTANVLGTGNNTGTTGTNPIGAQAGITGRIVTCPKFESDNATLSPLAGQAVIANLMADKFSVQAYPAADRIARGEEWLQTNTLDGQHPHDAFVRVGEPGYFQEFGPSGYHVSIGFANPKIINDRKAAVCIGAYGAVGPCSNTIQGQVDVQRLSRTPDQRLYPSGSRDALAWTQCWVSLGDPDAEDFMFTKCDANGNFKFTGVPGGNWRLTIGDQWNDQIIDGLSTPANVGSLSCTQTATQAAANPPTQTCPPGTITSLDLGNIGVQQWQSNIYTRLFVDDNKNGIKDPDEIGVPQVYTHVRYRDGHSANVLLTDPDGIANFNETFPLFSWYVVEPDLGRYKRTGTHTVYDAGGPADGSSICGKPGVRPCGPTGHGYDFLANTYESLPLPADLHVPGAVYCAAADCAAEADAFSKGTANTGAVTNSTGRLDPPWVNTEGWSGMTSQGNWIEFGVAPFAGCPPACVNVTSTAATVPTSLAVPVSVTSGGAGYAVGNAVTFNGGGGTGAAGTVTSVLAGNVGTVSAVTVTAAGSGYTSPTVTFSPPSGTGGSTATGTVTVTAGAVTGITITSVGTGYTSAPTVTITDSTGSTGTGATATTALAGSITGVALTSAGAGYTSIPTVGVTSTTGTGAVLVATLATTTQVGENGGIHGHVTFAATRPFDSASLMIEQPWSPNVPNVTLNLYQEGFAADGVTPTLRMVDTTQSSSWDDWAQGFYPNSSAGLGTGAGQKPYMSCPGQGTSTGTNSDLFFFSLYDQPEYLDWYNFLHGVGPLHTLPYNSQFKCYDSMHIWNQIQPAPYDGYYQFPSSTGINPTTGASLGTNCTACVPNPDTSDVYRVGTPMLPPGKYVVEVVMPPGYEVYKEEDKNLLIGDNYIAPATVQFSNLGGSIFIMPDQASVASLYDPAPNGYNPNNYQNQTTALGLGEQLALPGFPGYQDPIWPCVGELRVVPDFLSEFPHAQEVAPFAGAIRPLCDRKEVTLADQVSVSAKFYIFTSTHIAAKFTGVITDDFTAEFDPFSPQFGEKFSPPNMPVSTKDYLGNEISRVYADHWGTYEGMSFSSWDVNPPNITGYGPSMMVQCMNDKGPILDTRATIPDPNNPAATITNPTYGQMITDPLYNPAYSQFCYEEPYMPGLTTYLDTPVVPTQAFVGAAYNNADCAYPDTTPAIKEVDGDGIGPWVSAAGHTLTITALGNVQVDDSGYSGPSANKAPFNLKKVQRHYGFGPAPNGTGCNGGNAACPNVTVGGLPLNGVTWSDTVITGTIPSPDDGIPLCPIQQQAEYLGVAGARCGQLVITAASGRLSIDTVTVTIGGKPPVHVAASQTIQSAIDAAMPGDLIIVDPTCNTLTGTTAGTASCQATLSAGTTFTTRVPATHNEMVIMWKPVRLQGAGAASTIIDANAHPSGKQLGPWRQHVNCFFGLALNGAPYTAAGGKNVYDPSGNSGCPDTSGVAWSNFTGTPDNPQIDRMPLEAVVGWDANLNGNIAELLQEPTLMGAYEGAGITVLAKGLEFHGQPPWSDGTEPGAFPAVTTLLSGVASNPGGAPGTPGALLVGDANPFCHSGTYSSTGAFTITSQTNPYPSNFTCNPSMIDGLSVTDSSQGGGGIFIHGWAHHLQVANNRVFNNAGTLTGGISVGQGEFAGPYVVGSATNAAPGSCSNGSGLFTNQHMPDCFQLDVNVHNNMITNNSSLGDELFSATLSGGGGATICTGNDYYKFNYNWVCGNLSAGEGGGLVHLGEIQSGDIEHNSILFNQSSNPTIPTNGGGIMVQGTPDTDPVCVGVPDNDCPPMLSDGTGRNLVINANLIQGNSADSGSGGGIRLNQVNGTDVSTFPLNPSRWNNVSITNNIIVNNIAGWDGAGISLQDALNVSIVNNTIAHNDSLATSGVLTYSLQTNMASAPAGGCGTSATSTSSCPQSAGVTSTRNSTLLTTTFTTPPLCPSGQLPATGCRIYSNPILANNIIWQNRSFYPAISGPGTGIQNQQNLVTLYDAFSTTPAPAQTATGSCSGLPAFPATSYWDIGVRGDTGPTNHTGGTLTPTNSLISSGLYTGNNNSTPPAIPVVSQYCNGSRVPPECTSTLGCAGPKGFGVPPGIADAVTPNPVFSFTPSATVDEGNNWINVSWGPLALSNPAVQGTDLNWGGGPVLANYNLTAAIDTIPATVAHPLTDFYGNARPENGESTTGHFDPGAIEFGSSAPVAILNVSGGPLSFGSVAVTTPATTSVARTLTLHNTGAGDGTGITVTLAPGVFTRSGGTCPTTTTFTLAGGATCTVSVVFTPTAVGAVTGTATFTANVPVTGSPVTLTGTGMAIGRLSFTAATNGTLSTVLGLVNTLTFTIPTPRAPVTSAVTVTNTGSAPLAITADTLTMNVGGLYSLTPATTCSFTTPLVVGGTCVINIRYATPTTRPALPDFGFLTVANNGTATLGGVTGLALLAQ